MYIYTHICIYTHMPFSLSHPTLSSHLLFEYLSPTPLPIPFYSSEVQQHIKQEPAMPRSDPRRNSTPPAFENSNFPSTPGARRASILTTGAAEQQILAMQRSMRALELLLHDSRGSYDRKCMSHLTYE